MNRVGVDAVTGWGDECRERLRTKVFPEGYGIEIFGLIFCLSLIIPLAIFTEIHFLNGRGENSPQPVGLELVNSLGTTPTPVPGGDALWVKESGTSGLSGFTGCRPGGGAGYFHGDRGESLKRVLARFPRAVIMILMIFIFYQSSRTSSEEEPAFLIRKSGRF